MTEGVVVLDDGRGLACCCVAPVSVATPAVIQSSGDPELRGPCPLHHTNLRLRRENERLRQQLAGGGERQAPAAEWREPGMRLIATGHSKPPTPTCQPRNTSPMPLPPRCRGRSRPRDVRAPRPAPGVPAADLDQRGELVIAAGAELEAVRGAAPEPLWLATWSTPAITEPAMFTAPPWARASPASCCFAASARRFDRLP